MSTLLIRRHAAPLGLAVLALAYAGATVTQAKEPGAPPPAKKQRKVLVSGDHFRQNKKPEGLIRTLTGNVKIKSDATVLTTNLAMYNEDTGVATSPGKLKVDEPDNTLIGNTGTAFYKTRDVKIRDAVVIEIRPRAKDRNAPKGSTRSQFKDPITINCQKVDYNWRTKIAEMTGDLIFRQKERTVTADRAIYNGNTETLTLIGNVEYKSVKGDKGYGEKAVAVLREGDEDFQVWKVKDSEFLFDDEDEEAPAKPAPGEGSTPAGEPANTPATTPAPATPPTTPPTTPGNIPGTNPATNPPANAAPAGGSGGRS